MNINKIQFKLNYMYHYCIHIAWKRKGDGNGIVYLYSITHY